MDSMTNDDIIKDHLSICQLGISHIPAYLEANVRLMMDAARKDEALKAIEYVLNHSTGKWYKLDAEELYELFKKGK